MLHLLLEAQALYPAQWLALDGRMKVVDHCADLPALRERMLALRGRFTFFFVPAPPPIRLLPSALW